MNELMEAVEALNSDKVQIQALSMAWTSEWTVWLEKSADGVLLKVEAKAETLAGALNDALAKWRRITEGVTEFRGQLLEHVRPAQDFDDEIPF